MGSLGERQAGHGRIRGVGVFWGPQPDSLGTQEGRRKRAIAIELGEARWA